MINFCFCWVHAITSAGWYATTYPFAALWTPCAFNRWHFYGDVIANSTAPTKSTHFFPFSLLGWRCDPEYGIQRLKYQAFLIRNSIENCCHANNDETQYSDFLPCDLTCVFHHLIRIYLNIQINEISLHVITIWGKRWTKKNHVRLAVVQYQLIIKWNKQMTRPHRTHVSFNRCDKMKKPISSARWMVCCTVSTLISVAFITFTANIWFCYFSFFLVRIFAHTVFCLTHFTHSAVHILRNPHRKLVVTMVTLILIEFQFRWNFKSTVNGCRMLKN